MKLEKEVKVLARLHQMGPAPKIRRDEAGGLKGRGEALRSTASLRTCMCGRDKSRPQRRTTKVCLLDGHMERADKTRNVHLRKMHKDG